MKTPSSNKWNNAAEAYAKMAADPTADAYEYQVNFPSLKSLLSNCKGTVLDVGTGSGDFTPVLAEQFTTVAGTDVSQSMLKIAQARFPSYQFKIWDLETTFTGTEQYDVIVCKLVLMFVKDLNNVAVEFRRILKKNGSVIISVVHPLYWYHNYILNLHKIDTHQEFSVLTDGYYSTGKKIQKHIGNNKDLKMDFVHRTIADYIKPFTDNGLVLSGIDEPQITSALTKTNSKFADRQNVPTRLNYRLEVKS